MSTDARPRRRDAVVPNAVPASMAFDSATHDFAAFPVAVAPLRFDDEPASVAESYQPGPAVSRVVDLMNEGEIGGIGCDCPSEGLRDGDTILLNGKLVRVVTFKLDVGTEVDPAEQTYEQRRAEIARRRNAGIGTPTKPIDEPFDRHSWVDRLFKGERESLGHDVADANAAVDRQRNVGLMGAFQLGHGEVG